MDLTHLHLVLNHFPIVGSIIAVIILGYGIVKKNFTIQNIALYIFIGVAIIAIPVYFSGEEAEESVEHFTNVSKKMIHEHEELAEKGIILIEVLGLASLFALYNDKKQLIHPNLLIKGIFIFSIITALTFAFIGNYGGQIRHSEIRKNKQVIQYNNEDDDADND